MSLLSRTALLASAGRVAIGAAMIAAPRQIGESWIGEPARYERVTVLTRATGARDMAVGAIAVAGFATENDTLARAGLLGGCVSDATDFLAMVAVRDKLPPGSFARIGPLAAGFTIICAAAAAELSR